MKPIVCVVGARPNYMKMAPIVKALAAHEPPLPYLLVHTGQHYDHAMNAKLFGDLALPDPDVNLEVGSATHAVQTAEVMKRFEPVLDQHGASAVLVVGDVNSTIACALVAAKKGIPVVHVEAGLRSFDRAMPEEINRVLTDQIADILYTTEAGAADNLFREGIPETRFAFVGNVMIDSLRSNLGNAVSVSGTLAASGHARDALDSDEGFALVTLHRPSNVDDADTFTSLVGTLIEVSKRLPVAFAIHPRTRSNLERFGLLRELSNARIVQLPPQGYLEMLGLMSAARVVLTDSGGIQEETTALGVPCLTLRENTERPITVDEGTNTLVGRDRQLILDTVDQILRDGGKSGRAPALWDGRAAERIAAHLHAWLTARAQS
ncbi:non-hydrolyzing UDP-N-acetylglucosamine 2-epimerase [Niveibacterium umoris]|uniref:UDP-N-acetylglucosamine 2-epimerase (Non-hydrolyzing) n=1 Tax=Niveibacterium umoris TaxID=1193620 RepID=A0A840BGP2_9RHOO|nr:UDP-N-acetylglucosamine 2-epimerase (non-hydrolyzing) [Niveibacterium umoris]